MLLLLIFPWNGSWIEEEDDDDEDDELDPWLWCKRPLNNDFLPKNEVGVVDDVFAGDEVDNNGVDDEDDDKCGKDVATLDDDCWEGFKEEDKAAEEEVVVVEEWGGADTVIIGKPAENEWAWFFGKGVGDSLPSIQSP